MQTRFFGWWVLMVDYAQSEMAWRQLPSGRCEGQQHHRYAQSFFLENTSQQRLNASINAWKVVWDEHFHISIQSADWLQLLPCCMHIVIAMYALIFEETRVRVSGAASLSE